MLVTLQAPDGPLQQAWGDKLGTSSAEADGEQPAAEAPRPFLHPTAPLSRDTILIPSLRAGRRRRLPAAAGTEDGRTEEGVIGKHCLRPGTHVVVVDRCVLGPLLAS